MNILQAPLFDLTVINGIESIFHDSSTDPWAARLAGRYADFFIYSDSSRYMLPTSSKENVPPPEVPKILAKLINRDSDIFVPVYYDTTERRVIAEEYLIPTFANFDAWAKNNSTNLKLWLKVHHEPWLKKGHLTRVRDNLVFSVESLKSSSVFKGLVNHLNVTDDQILYAFDVILRYPIYGEFVGERAHYLSHPIREGQVFSTMEVNQGIAPNIPLSFANAISSIAKKLSLDEYTVVLHELRNIVRDKQINKLKPGEVSKEVRREIAELVSFPARLKSSTRMLGIMGGVASIISAFVAAPPMAVIGGAVSVASALWRGTLPRFIVRNKWLRWTVEYDFENENQFQK